MPDPFEPELVADIARDVVAEVAPEQLPLYRPIKDEYVKNPNKIRSPQRHRDEMLGSGIGGVEEIIIPVALSVSGYFAHFLWEEMRPVMRGAGTEVFKVWLVARWRGKRKPPALTPEQVRRVRTMAAKEAKKSGAPDELAERIAGVLAARLAS